MKRTDMKKILYVVVLLCSAISFVHSSEIQERGEFIVQLDMFDDQEFEEYDSVEVPREVTHLPGNGIIEEYGGWLLLKAITCQEYMQNQWSKMIAWIWGKKNKVKKRYAR